ACWGNVVAARRLCRCRECAITTDTVADDGPCRAGTAASKRHERDAHLLYLLRLRLRGTAIEHELAADLRAFVHHHRHTADIRCADRDRGLRVQRGGPATTTHHHLHDWIRGHLIGHGWSASPECPGDVLTRRHAEKRERAIRLRRRGRSLKSRTPCV